MSATTLSSHVLDLAQGRPAAGLAIELWSPLDAPQLLAQGRTNDDGRVGQWEPVPVLESGVYELVFYTGPWFAQRGETSFYPEVRIRFEIDGKEPHYHVPLLLNRFGYSTYRGS